MRQKTLLSLGAFAITGCAFRPWTPSVAVAYWADDVPTYREVSVPRSNTISAEWELPPQNSWSRYQKQTLIASLDGMPSRIALPDIGELGVIGEAQKAGESVGRAGVPSDVMFVVDLRGAASCAFGAAVSRASAQPVSNVVTFNNWPADAGLIPAEETLAGMLRFAPAQAATTTSAPPIFLLDSWRLAYRFDEPDEETYDNRYVLSAADLPDHETLAAAGISRVVYVVEDLDEAEYEEDDLHEAFAAYRDAGINLYMVDLGVLERGGDPDRLRRTLDPYVYYVGQRVTILDSPVFYARAHSGFGGIHGRPSGWGGSGSGGFHGGTGGGRGGGFSG